MDQVGSNIQDLSTSEEHSAIAINLTTFDVDCQPKQNLMRQTNRIELIVVLRINEIARSKNSTTSKNSSFAVTKLRLSR